MKDRLLTGLQPSGNLTIGNYVGGIKQITDYADNYDTYLFVPDLHAITVRQDPALLRKRVREVVGIYLACGVDPEKVHLYVQSENLYHANLSWLLECHTTYGELQKMTQFKTKSRNHDYVSCGLFTYPVLMAADILLYSAKYVPTGADQTQHVELARDIAQKFNNRYGEHFVMPNCLIPKIGARIRDLQEPEKKMSKSAENPKASIFLMDEPKDIKKKIMSAVTDSEGVIRYDEQNQPGIANLLTIYAAYSGCTVDEAVQKFTGAGYGDLKKAVVAVLTEKLGAFREEYERIMATSRVDDVLDAGRDYTTAVAKEKYDEIRNVLGLGR